MSENCPEPQEGAGWVIHDYLEYQPTKDEAESAKKKQQQEKSTGGKLGNHRRWHAAGDQGPGLPVVRLAIGYRSVQPIGYRSVVYRPVPSRSFSGLCR